MWTSGNTGGWLFVGDGRKWPHMQDVIRPTALTGFRASDSLDNGNVRLLKRRGWMMSKIFNRIKRHRPRRKKKKNIQVSLGVRRYGIAQCHRAGLRPRRSGVWIPAGAGNFSLHHGVQTGSGAQLSLLSNGYKGLFPWGVKRPGSETDH
jgi:hypothetical protein